LSAEVQQSLFVEWRRGLDSYRVPRAFGLIVEISDSALVQVEARLEELDRLVSQAEIKSIVADAMHFLSSYIDLFCCQIEIYLDIYVFSLV